MARPTIYVAGPIRLGDRGLNASRAIEAGRQLALAGWAPMVPHLWECATEDSRPYETGDDTWLEVDLPWVKVADAVYRIGGESAGAEKEVNLAHMNRIPVYYETDGIPMPGVMDRLGEVMRQFDTGATRNVDESKYDYEGFISPIVLERFAEYMHKHRVQADGELRASDNWQKGIPKDAYIKSAWRHFHDWWMKHRDYGSREGLEEALCALLFNVMGYLFEVEKEKA